jgi:hypothetical protein
VKQKVQVAAEGKIGAGREGGALLAALAAAAAGRE